MSLLQMNRLAFKRKKGLQSESQVPINVVNGRATSSFSLASQKYVPAGLRSPKPQKPKPKWPKPKWPKPKWPKKLEGHRWTSSLPGPRVLGEVLLLDDQVDVSCKRSFSSCLLIPGLFVFLIPLWDPGFKTVQAISSMFPFVPVL